MPPELPPDMGDLRALDAERRLGYDGMMAQKVEPKGRGPKPPLRFTLYKNIDPTPNKTWLVENFIGDGEIACLFGSPGTAKSALADDMSAHVAAGMSWFGRRVEQGGVLYVAAERHAVQSRRLAAWRKHHGIDDIPLALIGGAVDLRTGRAHADLIAGYARDIRDVAGLPCRLIVIDTVSRVLAGGDENSPKDVGALVANLTYLQEATGAAILALHHIPADGTQRLRGHGALLGAVDVTIRLEHLGNVRTAAVDKTNDGEEGERVTFELESVALNFNEETGMTTTAPVVIPSDAIPEKASSRQKMTDKQRLGHAALMDLIADHGTAAPATFGLPQGVSTVSVDEWREELFRRGILDRDAANPRQDFIRLKEQLKVRSMVAEKDKLVWQARAA